ncbi:MAG: class I SAM-dependent methyltransferase, partial [Luteolibacter sp.]
DGGCLICAMPNTAGAARFEKLLATACGPLHSIQKNKCRAFYATHNENWDDSRFNEWRKLGRRQVIDTGGFISQAGTFSHGRIDKGSELMAQHMPANLHGTVADLGAGWGYLTRSALERCPAIEQIDAYEIDSRAIDCARINLNDYQHKTHFHWHDVTAGLPDATYDAITTNPPFHSGQETDLNLAIAFLSHASRALKRGGSLHLVANRQLPYERVLDSLNLAWRPIAQNEQFKIITATKR